MHISVTITKRGRPIARVVPLREDAEYRPTMGGVTLIAESDEAYYSTGEPWDAESPG
jgi:antitoxin (DNA-binding transcriptional repressor) of toxin-antitoxin stability system